MGNREKQYYWLKLPLDFLDRVEMRHLRRETALFGDTLELYIRLLGIAGMYSPMDGALMLDDETEMTPSDIADLYYMPEPFVTNAVQAMESAKLIKKVDGILHMVRLPEMIGTETAAAGRMRKSRSNRAPQPPIGSDRNTCYTQRREDKTRVELEESKKRKEHIVRSVDPPVYELIDYFSDRIREADENFTVRSKTAWVKHMDYLIRVDKRTPEEIREVIDFLRDSTSHQAVFWRPNILSAEKLRKEFPRLKEYLREEKAEQSKVLMENETDY